MPSLGHGEEEEEDEESVEITDPLPEKLRGSVVGAFYLISRYSDPLSFILSELSSERSDLFGMISQKYLKLHLFDKKNIN